MTNHFIHWMERVILFELIWENELSLIFEVSQHLAVKVVMNHFISRKEQAISFGTSNKETFGKVKSAINHYFKGIWCSSFSVETVNSSEEAINMTNRNIINKL